MKKLKILLIHPEISRTKYDFAEIIEDECLELEYIVSVLNQNNIDSEIFDLQVEKISVNKKINIYKPDIVYLCGKTRQENFILEYCKTAKDINKNIITIIGGIHAQLNYKRMFKIYVDYILITFDIFKIIDIINYEKKLNKIKLKQISGICYKKKKLWFINKSEPFDINKLPLPDRSYFYKYPNNYRYLNLEHAAYIKTALCCPYKCIFCYRNKLNNGKYITRDIKLVVEEIKNLKNENIYIIDDDFLFDKNRIKEFIRLIKKNKIKKKYICYARADFISNNEDIIKELKEIGFYYLLVGLETFNDKQLKLYNKKSTSNSNINAIKICNKTDINIMGLFIIDENYTKKDFKILYKWIKDHELKNAAVTIFTPEMGTEVYEQYKDIIISNNPSHWDYLHLVVKPSKMTVKGFYLNYYILLLKLFNRARKHKTYDFINYKEYMWSIIINVFTKKRKNDDE